METNALEHRGAIVVDGIDATAVLPEEEHASQEEAIHDFFVGSGGLERLPEAKANGGALLLQGLVDRADLLDHVYVIRRQLADPAEILNGIFPTSAREQPARRLFEENCTNEEQTGWNQLHSKGNDPLLVAGSQGFTDTVLHGLASEG